MENNPIIDPVRFYSLYEIVKGAIIPGADSYNKIKRVVSLDAMTNKILKPSLTRVDGSVVKYRIKGENIIKYLASKEDQSI